MWSQLLRKELFKRSLIWIGNEYFQLPRPTLWWSSSTECTSADHGNSRLRLLNLESSTNPTQIKNKSQWWDQLGLSRPALSRIWTAKQFCCPMMWVNFFIYSLLSKHIFILLSWFLRYWPAVKLFISQISDCDRC